MHKLIILQKIIEIKFKQEKMPDQKNISTNII